jgi:hypothetical protein
MPNLVQISLVGTMLCYLPPRALWRVSAGCDTGYDGWVREGQALGCSGTTACVGAPSQPSAAKHAPWPQVGELRPMQLAVTACTVKKGD